MKTLAQFFKAPSYQSALANYADTARCLDWRIRDKLELYNWAKVAFESTQPEHEQRQAFHKIYNDLKGYWKVFRNASSRYWSADEVFDGLNRECKACRRNGSLTLLAIRRESHESQEVLRALGGLRELKPATYYPWMPVAKFTHFFNPRLFPLYDDSIIWKKVLDGVFRDDYCSWCRKNSLEPNPKTERFNLNYMLFAGDCIRQADNDFMAYFSQWFKGQVGNLVDEQKVLNDLPQYYATAFEFVAIGAACSSQEVPARVSPPEPVTTISEKDGPLAIRYRIQLSLSCGHTLEQDIEDDARLAKVYVCPQCSQQRKVIDRRCVSAGVFTKSVSVDLPDEHYLDENGFITRHDPT